LQIAVTPASGSAVGGGTGAAVGTAVGLGVGVGVDVAVAVRSLTVGGAAVLAAADTTATELADGVAC
jgi:hypothetical protein